jgi:AcrR family transcriptional regulator
MDKVLSQGERRETSRRPESAPPGRLSLRERKKARTRAAIQQHALRLFKEQGYAATTIEQIAEAVEISPSTFFRYFPNKEDVVMYDDLDPLLIAAFEAQPPERSPVEALRGALHAVFLSLSEPELDQQLERARLIIGVPELRMRMLDQFYGVVQLLADLVARRSGRTPDEIAVRSMAGAMMGVLLAVVIDVGDDVDPTGIVRRMDASLALLNAGLPL